MITRNERFLAALIFVLWSFGVVVLPALGQSGVFDFSNGMPSYLLWPYFSLHVVILAYVGYSLVHLLRRKRKPKKEYKYIVAIYAYAALMLLASMYLISRNLFIF